MSDENDELSLTVLKDALENDIPLDDPEVIALAKAARKRRKESWLYITKESIKKNIPKMVAFIGVVAAGVITAWIKG